jgi:hypothetical protein
MGPRLLVFLGLLTNVRGSQTEEAEKLLAQSDAYALALLTSALGQCVKLESDATGPAVVDLQGIVKEQHAKVSQQPLEFC